MDSDLILTGIPPERRNALYEEIAKESAERIEAALLGVLVNGYLYLMAQKPKERLIWYESQTLDIDRYLLLDHDYLKKRETGEAPKLWVELMAEDYMAAQQALALPMSSTGEGQMISAGSDAPPALPEPPPMMWPILVPPSMPARVFQYVQSDYIKLVRMTQWQAAQKQQPTRVAATRGAY